MKVKQANCGASVKASNYAKKPKMAKGGVIQSVRGNTPTMAKGGMPKKYSGKK